MMTKSVKRVMDLLWSIDKPLSCSEIVELSGEKTWKDSYVHLIIKSLMKTGIVKIESFEVISRKYAWKFAPKVTKEEYYLNEYFDESPENVMSTLVSAFAQTKVDAETVDKIEEMI